MFTLKKKKQIKSPQLAIRMGQDAVDDFNNRVGDITDKINQMNTYPRDSYRLRKNLLYQIILEMALETIESLTLEEQSKLLQKRIGKLKFPDYHK